MGCGKTTIGKLLALKLSYLFIDLDEEIEKFTNQTINEIFNNQGEDAFRKTEHEILQSIILLENIVVATGGGTPCYYKNINTMNKEGIAIYLKSSPDILLKRLLIEKEKRPLIKTKNSEELSIFIKSKLQERETFYNQASITIDTKKHTSKYIVEIIYNHYAEESYS